MTIRWDAEARVLSLSVRDLAEVGGGGFGGGPSINARSRAQMGAREHIAHQSRRSEEDADYRAELGLSHEWRFGDTRVRVSGRIDGVYRDGDTWVIEEIKTVIGAELSGLTEDSHPEYTRQLRLYRTFLEAAEPGEPGRPQAGDAFDLRLVFIALPSRETRHVAVSYDPAECWSFVEQRVRAILAALAGHEKIREDRRRRAASVAFPYPGHRRFQRELEQDIAAALDEGKDVLASAATGIGKSAAALVPALQRAMAEGGQVFVATSKTTQHAMFLETVKALAEAGAEVNAVVLTAREKVCQNDVVLCHPDACIYAQDYVTKVEKAGLLDAIAGSTTVDAEGFVAHGIAAEACPFELALDAIERADVIIGDYNYAFDPGASVRRLFVDGDPSGVVLLIDEAHNLIDRAAGYYSPQLSRGLLAELREQSATEGGSALQALDLLGRQLDAYLERLERGEEGEEPEPEPEPDPEPEPLLLFDDPELARREKRRRPSSRATRRAKPRPAPRRVADERIVHPDKDFFFSLRDQADEVMLRYFLALARQRRPILDDAPAVRFYRSLTRFATVLEMDGPAFHVIYARSRFAADSALKILCMDPSGPLSERLGACRAAVAFSATLTPLDFYQRLLGFPEDAALLRYGSPFEAARRGVFVDDRLSLRFENREREAPAIARAIEAVSAARPGNVIAGFPSYGFLEMVAPLIADSPERELIIQARSMPDAARRAVLERLADFDPDDPAGPPPVLLLAVQGGVFTEGVDYPGERCVGVVLVGPALPRVCFERKLIRDYFEAKSGRGFEDAYLIPGMNRAIQAAGRVHRRESDTGVIVLLGSRFLQSSYARLLPEEWYEDHPRELATRRLGAAVKRFWDRVP